ncbi:putative peptidoglycan lipid II flippase MurJ [Labilithrix luteola]|uniref:Probable lipid II flippase MurJ n=1 Tax=Labilithrix luteola TaxID=1391654 RepID=A0A0K1Q7D0_9BACT|nr:putative peptidoglycan lipid II flippase MurJ [Labilithrix luteola]
MADESRDPAGEGALETVDLAESAEGAPEAPEIAVQPAHAAADAGNKEREKLVGRAGIVGAGTLLSRVLGFGRDVVIAALFTRSETDAFSVALTIPNALRQLLAEGAVSSAVVPVLSLKLATGGDKTGRAFFAKARGVSLVALVVVSILGILFAEPLTDLFGAGYRATPGKFERTVEMTRVMFPYIFFMGTAAMGMAALNAKRRFAVAAFAPGLFNVALIFAALLLRRPLEERGIDGSMALAVGVLLGGLLQVLAQLPALRGIGYVGRPVFDFRDPDVREMLRRILPMTFGLGVYYVDLTLSRRFLSELGEGAQSYFFWASRLCDFPQGIFVMALSTAALPSLASFAAKGDREELAKTWAHGMRLSLFVALPCSVALAALGEPLVVLLFQRGHFDAESAHQTARALVWQGGAIFTVAAARQLIPPLHALGDTRTPVIVSALDLVAFIVLALLLRGPYGHVGISIAVAGSSFVQAALLMVGVKWRLGTLRARELVTSTAKIAAASAIAGIGGWGAARLLEGGVEGALGRALPGLAGSIVFAGLYLIAAWGLGVRELGEVAAPIRRRLARRASPGRPA